MKYVFISFSALLFIIIFILFLQGGLLFISSSNSKDITVYIKSETDEYWQEKNIQPNGWGLYYFKNSNYLIQSTQNKKETMITKDISSFSFNRVDVGQFKNQHASISLGFSDSDCVINNKDTGYVTYYFCNSSAENNNYISTTNNSITFKDSSSGTFVYPHNEGFIDILKNNGSTLRYKIPDQVDKYITINDVEISSYGHFSTDLKNKKNDYFILLDSTTLYIFNTFSSSYKKVDVKKYINTDPSFSLSLKIVDNKIYILNSINSDLLEQRGDLEYKPKKDDIQKIIIFSTTGSFISEEEIPTTYSVEDWDISKESLVIRSNKGEESGLYKINNKNIKRVIPFDQITSWCVAGDSIYYIQQNNPNNIYKYSNNNTSYLSYRNNSKILSSVSCLYNRVYTSLVDSSGDSSYNWVELDSNPSLKDIKSRSEEIFPLYDDTEDIEYSYTFKDMLLIKLKSESGCEIPEYKKSAVLSYIKTQTIIDGLKPVFNSCL